MLLSRLRPHPISLASVPVLRTFERALTLRYSRENLREGWEKPLHA